MAQHQVTYDDEGIATNDPWSLDDYLVEDGIDYATRERVQESVLSWLREYDFAGVDLHVAMAELEPNAE